MDILHIFNIMILCYAFKLSIKVWSESEYIFEKNDFLKEIIDEDKMNLKMIIYIFVSIIHLYCVFKLLIKVLIFNIESYLEKLNSESECIYEKFVLIDEIIEDDKMNLTDGFFLMSKHKKDFEIIKSKFISLHRVFKMVNTFDTNTSFTIRIN